MSLTIYVAAILLGGLSSRATLVAYRGGYQDRHPFRAVLGFVSTFGTIGLLVAGFFWFPWYWPVGVFVAAAILQTVLISTWNLGLWLRFSPLLDVLVVGALIYLIFFRV
jgi:hypothetical protein